MSNIIRKEFDLDENYKVFIKFIYSKEEKEIIKEFIETLARIKKDSMYPKIYTFSARTYTSNILTKMIKYDIINNTVPLEKYKIVDIKYLLGNFNDLIPTLNYLELNNKKYENIIFETEKLNDENYLKNFLKFQLNKAYSINLLTCKLIESTYTTNWNMNDIVVDIETEPLLDKYNEFIQEFQYLSDNPKEKIIEFMKNNPIYSKIIGISIGKIIEKEKEEI